METQTKIKKTNKRRNFIKNANKKKHCAGKKVLSN